VKVDVLKVGEEMENGGDVELGVVPLTRGNVDPEGMDEQGQIRAMDGDGFFEALDGEVKSD